jgi:flavorubredoxin
MEEAAKYYANILMPLGSLIIRKIQELTNLSISPKMIAPSHGIIWRSDPSKIVDAYLQWSKGTSKNKAVVVYDTMWGSTGKMAVAIAKGISNQEVEVKVLKLRAADPTEIVSEILDAKAIVVGSPTLNNSMFPTLGSFLTYLTGLKPKHKIWYLFGSYGWGGGAVKNMLEIMRKSGFEVQESSLEMRYIPTKEELEKCFEFGKQIAKKVREV